MASFKNLISNTSAQIASGGTITGDLVINGDLQVDGGGSLSFDEIIEGTSVIDVTDTEAFLVRKDSDGGDVFIVDTTNSRVGIGITPTVTAHISGTGELLRLEGANAQLRVDNSTTDTINLNVAGGSDSMTLSTGSTTALTIDSSQRVGIGGSPTSKLFISESTATSGQDGLVVEKAQDANQYALRVKHDSASSNRYIAGFQNSSGNVLLINSAGDSTFSGNVIVGTAPFSSSDTSLQIGDSGDTHLVLGEDANNNARMTWDASENSLEFHLTDSSTSRSNVLVLDSTGNVGIGIAPATTLNVASPVSADVTVFPTLRLTSQTETADWDAGDVNGVFEFYTADPSGNAPYVNAFIKSINEQENGTLPSGSLSFGTATYNAVGGAVERMRIDSLGNSIFSGNVKVLNTSAPNIRLNPDASDATDSHRAFIGYATGNDNFITGTVDNDLAIRSSATGNIVFGRGTTESARLDSSGNATFSGTITATSASDNVAKFESSDAIARIVIEDNASENNGNWIAVQNDVMSFATNGSNTALTLDSSQNATFAGDVILSSTNKLFLDGGSNTYIHHPSADALHFVVGNSTILEIDENGADNTNFVAIQPTNKFYLDSGVDTYIHEQSDNVIRIVTGNSIALKLDEDSRISLSNNDTGTANTVFGYQALNSFTATGHSNTVIGHQTARNASANAWQDNVAIGYRALNTSGAQNLADCVIIGSEAGYSINSTLPDGTVAIGSSSLYSLTSGEKNVSIGFESMLSQTTGANNTVIGYNALRNADGGESDNVVIGKEAGININHASADANVIIGSNAGFGGAGAMSGSVAIGANAMNSTGANTITGAVAVGYDSLGSMTSGENNSAVGYISQGDLTTGDYNTSLGNLSLQRNTDGSHNVAIGYTAGKFDSSANNATSPDQCVIIGSLSEFSSATPTNQIVIGYGADGQADNSVTLGNSSVNSIFAPTKTAIQSYGTVAITDGSTITFGGTNLGAAILCIYEGSGGIGGVFALSYQFAAVQLAGSADTSTSDTAGKVCVINGTNNHTVTVKNNTGQQRNFRIMVYSAALN